MIKPFARHVGGLVLASAMLVGFGADAREMETGPVIVGYVPVFKGLDAAIAGADLAAYTHFNLAFANPSPDGRFVDNERMACMSGGPEGEPSLDAVRASVARLQADGSKVLLSLGGGVIPGCSGDWAELLQPANRDALLASLIDLVDRLQLDGLDVDIEGVLLTRIDVEGNYVPFIVALSEALRSRGKLLTCATASYEGGMIPVGSIPYFDLIHLMSYDAIGPSWGEPGAEHSTLDGARNDLDLWIRRGARPEQIVLGVPFYGYGFGGEQAHWSYAEIVAAYPEAVTLDRIGAACADCRYITFNGPGTIERKARLAGSRAAGVMVWEITQDAPDHALTTAIARGLAEGGD